MTNRSAIVAVLGLLTLACSAPSPSLPPSISPSSPGSFAASPGPADQAGAAGIDDCAAATPGDPITVPILATGSRISGVGADPGFEQLSATVTVPAGCYAKIEVHYTLATPCTGDRPSGQNWPDLCDPYDRITHLVLADMGQGPLMLADAATPFGGHEEIIRDVTDYAPALSGTHTYAAYISTYADPSGTASGMHGGFDVAAWLVLTPGPVAEPVLAVTPLFFAPHLTASASPVAGELAIPPGATGATVELFSSGHGAEGGMECDEFCQKNNRLRIGDKPVVEDVPWQDCSQVSTSNNPTGDPESVTYSRAGWCPSLPIAPRRASLDPTALASPMPVPFAFEIEHLQGFWHAGAVVVFYR